MKVQLLLTLILLTNVSIAKLQKSSHKKQSPRQNKALMKELGVPIIHKKSHRGVELIEHDKSLERSLSLMRDKEKSKINQFFMALRNKLSSGIQKFYQKRKELTQKFSRETKKYYELKKEKNLLE
jgi:hypothetical protein